MNPDPLIETVKIGFTAMRERIAPHFNERYAYQGPSPTTKSGGHCAIVAVIVNRISGGTLVSTMINGQSHWWNRFTFKDENETITIDVDLTGDQFGFPEVNVSMNEDLYPDARVRHYTDIQPETWLRAMDMMIDMFAPEVRVPDELRPN